MKNTPTFNTPWRLPTAARKALLVLHAVSGLGWMGIDLALFVLLLNARLTDDPVIVISSFNAIRLIVPTVVPLLSVGVLATGLLLGLGTTWGLLRYWWVLVKLALSVVMTVLVFVALVPGINSLPVLAATTLSADAVRASLGDATTQLFFPPVVSFLMLGVAAVLSIFKPWRRTPWSLETRTRPSIREASMMEG